MVVSSCQACKNAQENPTIRPVSRSCIRVPGTAYAWSRSRRMQDVREPVQSPAKEIIKLREAIRVERRTSVVSAKDCSAIAVSPCSGLVVDPAIAPTSRSYGDLKNGRIRKEPIVSAGRTGQRGLSPREGALRLSTERACLQAARGK